MGYCIINRASPHKIKGATLLKITNILQIPSIRILLFLYQKGQARHAEISKLTSSRGTLSLSLKDLDQEGLIQRKVLDTKPPQSIYSLTEKGKTIAKQLTQIQQNIK